MTQLTKRKEWAALSTHQKKMSGTSMRTLFQDDAKRISQFSCAGAGLFLDYSRNRITAETTQLLSQLATGVGLPEKINDLFSGKSVNTTENRPALHTALRDKNKTPIHVNGKNIMECIQAANQKMRHFVDEIHSKQWLGMTGKPIAHIVNIGIGGSHLGPMMVVSALKDFAVTDIQAHFISSVDESHIQDVLQQINPETTLFMISSKSFSTLETLSNAKTILAWMKQRLGEMVLNRHFIAITAAPEKAMEWGIPESQIFPLWDWVGGRYSIWSAVGLPLRIMIGNQQFDVFLEGAHEMDVHFREADFTQNMPVLLALLSIWYSHFFNARARAIIPYAHRLRHFIAYLQQAEMESNGKSVDLNGNPIAYPTSSIIFGQEGCDGQHAYHQLLHQGQHLIPADFIVAKNSQNKMLLASAYAQAEALMRGKTNEEAYQELLAMHYPEKEARVLAQHKIIPGNRPSNILCFDTLNPKILGALIALYEHEIFVQGAIWNINSFDQWGVELGKQLLPDILGRISEMGSV